MLVMAMLVNRMRRLQESKFIMAWIGSQLLVGTQPGEHASTLQGSIGECLALSAKSRQLLVKNNNN